MVEINEARAELDSQLAAKFEHLQKLLTEMGSVLVAFSGGVDSTLVLKVAHLTLGSRSRGCLAISPSVPPSEVEAALATAKQMNAPVMTVTTDEMSNPDYVANEPNRCYFCKSELYTVLEGVAEREGFKVIADGFNVDDQGDYRPGRQAGREHQVRSPLLEAGLNKTEIRQLARYLGLANWDKPAAACLSSRIPYGTPVSVEVLAQIAAAEELLHGLGLRQVRVRHHERIARLEVPASDLPLLVQEPLRSQISQGLKQVGYAFVTLDLEGYRTGSLNELVLVRRNRKGE